jgi:HK97 family phage portal protein
MRPVWLWPVDGMSIQIYVGWAGGKDEARYLQTLGYGNVGGVQGTPLRNDELIYIRKDPTTENPFGFGPLEIAFATINRQLTTAEYAGNVAGNAQPGNILLFVGANSTQIQTLRSYWRDEIEGQGTIPIVGFEDLKVEKLHAGSDEALYLKYQQFILREIATAFGLSPQNLGLEADVNRNTSETSEDRDWNTAIIPMAQLLRSHLNRELIEGKLGFRQIEFKWIGLEREDETETARRYSIYYKSNAITPNEQRERMGMAPMKSKFGDMTAGEVQLLVGKKKEAGSEDNGDPEDEDGKD